MGAAVLVVVVAVVGAVALASQHGRGVPRASQTLRRVPFFNRFVVTANVDEFVRADFATLRIERAHPPPDTFTHYPTRLLRRRGGFVFATDGRVFAARLNLNGPLTPLGLGVEVLPARRDDRVWVVDLTRTSAREIDIHGRSVGAVVPLPSDGRFVAEVDGGWLVAAGARLEVRGEHPMVVTSDASIIDVTPSRVLWRGADGSVALTSFADGHTVRVADHDDVLSGALVPVGDALVLVIADPGGRLIARFERGDQPRGPDVALGLRGDGPAVVAWSSDGRIVFTAVAGSRFVAVDAQTTQLSRTGLNFSPAIAVG